MTSDNIPTTARNQCKYPGCDQAAAPATGPGRPPEYCEGRGHTKVTAWRERPHPAAAQAGTTPRPPHTQNPRTMAPGTRSEPLRSPRPQPHPLAALADRRRDPAPTVAAPTPAATR